MTTQKEWFDEVSKGHSLRSIAQAIGTSHGNLSNWLKADKLSAERVIAISYELEVDPVKSLFETGFLKEEPADEIVNKEELIARIERLITYLKKEIAQEEAEIISLDSKRNQPQSDTMFENMVADSSPDEDEQRLGDESDY